MTEEKVEEVLEFSIKIRTNTDKEKIIHFFDIISHIDSSLTLCHDDYDDLTQIKFNLNCLHCSMEITNA